MGNCYSYKNTLEESRKPKFLQPKGENELVFHKRPERPKMINSKGYHVEETIPKDKNSYHPNFFKITQDSTAKKIVNDQGKECYRIRFSAKKDDLNSYRKIGDDYEGIEEPSFEYDEENKEKVLEHLREKFNETVDIILSSCPDVIFLRNFLVEHRNVE